MYETVTLYRTVDGKLHDTEKKAEAHVLDMACDILERATAPLVHNGKMSRAEQLRVIETLAPDVDTVRALARSLDRLFTV